MKKIFLAFLTLAISLAAFSQDSTVRKKDRKRDVLLVTSLGDIVIHLSDSTPLHRDNFIKLVKLHYFDGILFHRVIQNFMIQAVGLR